eukprot:TRINITY_DN9963_c0_g1_i1.p1 TRINITY_DN9963_c0_g1~~TRINITY_DN9963_c0_g1_i1.p1  ORF type:complete len:377 (-),score=130.10 TRINITY_DN9963_c0_g1_i1:169-1230(-)
MAQLNRFAALLSESEEEPEPPPVKQQKKKSSTEKAAAPSVTKTAAAQAGKKRKADEPVAVAAKKQKVTSKAAALELSSDEEDDEAAVEEEEEEESEEEAASAPADKKTAVSGEVQCSSLKDPDTVAAHAAVLELVRLASQLAFDAGYAAAYGDSRQAIKTGEDALAAWKRREQELRQIAEAAARRAGEKNLKLPTALSEPEKPKPKSPKAKPASSPAAAKQPAVEPPAAPAASKSGALSFHGGVTAEVVHKPKNVASVVKKGTEVKLIYEGRLAKDDSKFDSGTIDFVVGDGSMIRGFDLAVLAAAESRGRLSASTSRSKRHGDRRAPDHEDSFGDGLRQEGRLLRPQGCQKM